MKSTYSERNARRWRDRWIGAGEKGTHRLGEHVAHVIHLENGDLVLVEVTVHLLDHGGVGAARTRHQQQVRSAAAQHQVLATVTRYRAPSLLNAHYMSHYGTPNSLDEGAHVLLEVMRVEIAAQPRPVLGQRALALPLPRDLLQQKIILLVAIFSLFFLTIEPS